MKQQDRKNKTNLSHAYLKKTTEGMDGWMMDGHLTSLINVQVVGNQCKAYLGDFKKCRRVFPNSPTAG